MQDFIISLNINLNFSDEEKQKCIPTARKMVHLANFAREQGILGLEEELETDMTNVTKGDPFMETGINLIINCLDTSIVKEVLQYLILSGGYTGADLLEKLLIAQGLTGIQEGYDPFVTANFMGAMLGEKYISEIVDLAKDRLIETDTLIDKYTFPLYESGHFESKMLKLTREDFSKALMNDINTLAIAFKGCSREFINSTLREAVSERFFREICESFRMAPNRDEILEAQAKILTNLEEFKKLLDDHQGK